jgi:hypothetical protein
MQREKEANPLPRYDVVPETESIDEGKISAR